MAQAASTAADATAAGTGAQDDLATATSVRGELMKSFILREELKL